MALDKKLIVTMDLDHTGFDRGIDAAKGKVGSLNNTLKSMLGRAFGTAAVLAFAKNTIDAVSKIADMSKELNVSAEAMQELDYAATLSGSSIDAVASAFKALSKARAEALSNPNSKEGQVFKAMGIDAAELKANSIEQTFRRVGTVIQGTDFGANELAMVAEILGRSGQELIPVFKNGLAEAAAEARGLGIVMKDEVVQQIDDAGDAIDKLIKRLRVPMADAIGFIAKQLRNVFDFLDLNVGGLGAAIGAKMGGGDWRQALDDHVNEVLERREQEDAADAKQGAAGAPERRKAAPFEFQAKAEKAERERVTQIQSDQFQRIGAFTGTSAAAGQRELAQRQLTALEKLREDLTRNGILIRGTD